MPAPDAWGLTWRHTGVKVGHCPSADPKSSKLPILPIPSATEVPTDLLTDGNFVRCTSDLIADPQPQESSP